MNQIKFAIDAGHAAIQQQLQQASLYLRHTITSALRHD